MARWPTVDSYDEVSRLATKGDRDAQNRLMEWAEAYLEAGDTARAAEVFREAAICYRIAAFRARTEVGEAGQKQWRAEAMTRMVLQWAQECMDAGRLPEHSCPGITGEQVRDIVIDELMSDWHYSWVFLQLQRRLQGRGIEFFSPGGSIQRHVWVLVECILGLRRDFPEDYWLYQRYADIRVLVDPIVDEVIRRAGDRAQPAG